MRSSLPVDTICRADIVKHLQVIGVVLLAIIHVTVAEAKVKGTLIVELIRSADTIVLAKVTKLKKGDGSPERANDMGDVAVAEVLEVWKGAVGKTVEFSLQKPWVCDISHAVIDERVVLILDRKYKGQEHVRVWPGLFFLSFAGRGRMPTIVRGEKVFARVQDEVVIPKLDLEFLSTPDFPDDNLVELENLKTYVKAVIGVAAAQQSVGSNGRSPATPARR